MEFGLGLSGEYITRCRFFADVNLAANCILLPNRDIRHNAS